MSINQLMKRDAMKHNHRALTLILPLLLLLTNIPGITATKPSEKCPNPLKNIIYIVPDGFGPASQTLARDYLSMLGRDPENPVIREFGVDEFVSIHITPPHHLSHWIFDVDKVMLF